METVYFIDTNGPFPGSDWPSASRPGAKLRLYAVPETNDTPDDCKMFALPVLTTRGGVDIGTVYCPHTRGRGESRSSDVFRLPSGEEPSQAFPVMNAFNALDAVEEMSGSISTNLGLRQLAWSGIEGSRLVSLKYLRDTLRTITSDFVQYVLTSCNRERDNQVDLSSRTVQNYTQTLDQALELIRQYKIVIEDTFRQEMTAAGKARWAESKRRQREDVRQRLATATSSSTGGSSEVSSSSSRP